ncbi:MAG: Crp/Fnr family transcriptional regulator [Bacteroidetes bacterium]|nr:Crp/Fnr family transcriptional regulator [Bacteroidota bacterium]
MLNHFVAQQVTKIRPLPEALLKRISDATCQVTLPKKTMLLKQGAICDRIYFIENGLARSFYVHGNEEITTWIMKENDMVISLRSFFTQTPSLESIELLENSRLEYLNYSDLQEIYNEYYESNIIGRLLTEYYYALSEERTYSLRVQNSKERYESLLKAQPNLVKRVPLKYIASYLSMAPETLSRLRAKTREFSKNLSSAA